MKVRTVCMGVLLLPEHFSSRAALEETISSCHRTALLITHRLESMSYEVQTVRLCTNSFESWGLEEDVLLSRVGMLLEICMEVGFGFISVGPASTPLGLGLVPKILAKSERLAASAMIGCDVNGVPHYDTCVKVGETMLAISDVGSQLRNFGFCASFNAPAHVPYFPAAFHEGPEGFSIGLENGDLLFLAFHGVTDFSQAEVNLTESLLQTYKPLSDEMHSLSAELGVQFYGIDASMCPSLLLAESVAKGFEYLPIAHFGAAGTLAVCSLVTSSIKSLATSGVTLCGYSGLMLPVMEDVHLAQRAEQQPPTYSIKDLVAYSSVCGVGLDTIPIPRSTSPEAIACLLMDLGSIAFKHNKPLTCRLFPVHGANVGDLTALSSPYLCNTRVFAV